VLALVTHRCTGCVPCPILSALGLRREGAPCSSVSQRVLGLPPLPLGLVHPLLAGDARGNSWLWRRPS